MGLNVTQKLLQSHLVDGDMRPETELGIRIDRTLTQEATGTMVMLEIEAMHLDRVQTDLSMQYVDHNPGSRRPGARGGWRGDLQAYIGSSADPGYCDFAVVAEIVKGRQVHPRVSFDVNPTSRWVHAQATQANAAGRTVL